MPCTRGRRSSGPMSPRSGFLADSPLPGTFSGSPRRSTSTGRRAPIAPSQNCEVCRAYYQDETDLNQEILGVLRDFPWQMLVQEDERERLLLAERLWSQEPHPAISPDILRAHYERKLQVLGLVSRGLREQEEAVRRWRTFHHRAETHHARISKKVPAAGSQPRARGGARNGRSGSAAQQREKPYLTRLPDRTVIDEHDPTSIYRRRWFHQKVTPDEAIMARDQSAVDSAEEAARLARRRHAERLRAEGNVVAAQIRGQLVRARDPDGAAQLWRRDATQPQRITRTLPREDAVRCVMDLAVQEDAPRRVGEMADFVAAVMPEGESTEGTTEEDEGSGGSQPALGCPRPRGDGAFWSAITRAQCLPDEPHALRVGAATRGGYSSPPAPHVEMRASVSLEQSSARRGTPHGEGHPRDRYGDFPDVRAPPLPPPEPLLSPQSPGITPARPGHAACAAPGASAAGAEREGKALPPNPLQEAADRLRQEQRKVLMSSDTLSADYGA
eukprot:TRINITY_DN7050_c1_g1_i1.p1 TRINITY_DN7050_c1_g1~~TRINITY_DN7050_c1_g1_i1.p1  ORF type:complete len:501 (+),score=115.98 TRINITY_DN7050_c1_g1_i1:77-1579(+)